MSGVARVFDVPGHRVGVVREPYRAKYYNDCWRPNRTATWGNVTVFYKYRKGAWRAVYKTTESWHRND